MSDSTITAMPPAALPLANEAVPCVQDGVNVQSPAAAFGIPIAASSPPVSLAQYQTWIDESTHPPTVRMSLGPYWKALYTLDCDGVLSLAQPLTLPGDPSFDGQAATKHYVDNRPTAPGTLVFKEVLNCSGNPNYPAANQGDLYIVGSAGKIGGASGVDVEGGDTLLCLVDHTLSGDHDSAGANWTIGQGNIDDAVTGPVSAIDGNFVQFIGTTGKTIKDSGLSLDTDATMAANSDGRIPSQKAVKNSIGGKPLSGDPLSQGQVWAWDTVSSTFRADDGEGQNFLVNSAFDIWQESTSYTLSPSAAKTHVADFWKAGAEGAGNRIVSQTNGIHNCLYAMKFQRVLGSTDIGAFHLVQQFAHAESVFLSGKIITVSFDFVVGAEYSNPAGLFVTIFHGTGIDEDLSLSSVPINFPATGGSVSSADLSPQIASPGTTTRIVSTALSIPAGKTELALDIRTGAYSNSAAEADDSFTIGNIKLEIGNVATSYRKSDAGEELKRCQWRYFKTFRQASMPIDGIGCGTGEHRAPATIAGAHPQTLGTVRFPIMRTVPVVTLFNPATGGAAGQARDIKAWTDCTSTVARNIAEGSCEIVTMGSASTEVGNTLGVHAVMDARL